MLDKEAIHELGFVGEKLSTMRWISSPEGPCSDRLLEKADRLLAGVAAGSASEDLAAPCLEGGIKGEGAATEDSNP